jgi:hypothetical protein
METETVIRFIVKVERRHANSYTAYLICGHEPIARSWGSTPENAIEHLNGHSIAIGEMMELGAGVKF